MDPQAPDHGLVLGAIALQLGLISREQLGEVLKEWLANPSCSPAQSLLDRGYLSQADLQRLLAASSGPSTGGDRASDRTPGQARHSLPTLASQTIGTDQTEPLEAVRTIGQTIRELDSPGVRRFSGIALSELNASHQRFKLVRPHAKGGLGVVSVAHDVELDREVAVKEMRIESVSDDAVQRFMMEAKVTGQLDHPGIPPVYALGYFEDGRPFYVMRLIDGVTLKRAVEDFHNRYPPPDTTRQRSLELRKLLGAFVSVCHTLRYAHSRHVLHRDIKPSNIMLGNYGETLVLDWGLAKCREESLPYSELEAKAHQSKRRSDDPTLTGTGSVLGTPHYMSPEQARGQWESVNLRSEVYSLGATLYTLLTGKLPFSGTTREAVLEQVRQGNCRRPRDVDPRIPPELDAICMKAMALEREDRFATAGELASEIEHWLADEPVMTYRETPSRRWQRWLKTHQTALATLAALVAGGLLAVIGGGIVVSYEHRRAQELQRKAESEGQRAEKNADTARYYVGRFLALNYHDILSQVPGSEQPRLALLNETIGQLKQWAVDNPDDLPLRLNIAEAFRARSRLYWAMNQPDKAWADLALALDIIENVTNAPMTPLHAQMILTRLYALNEMADMIGQRYGPRATLRVLLPAQRQAAQLLEQNAADLSRRVALYDLNVTLARQLYRLKRTTEAAELIDGAVSQFEVMHAAMDHWTPESGLDNGPETILLLTCEARQLQASIAYSLDDYVFAQSCLDRAEQLCDRLLQKAPSAFDPLAIKLDVFRLRAELARASERPELALSTIRQTSRQSVGVASRFPTSQQFALAAARAELLHAVQELNAGTLTRATEAAAYAINAFKQLSSPSGSTQPAWPLELARAHRVRSEIALAEGDSAVAAAHCHAARSSLATAAANMLSLEGVAEESEQIEFVASQANLLR